MTRIAHYIVTKIAMEMCQFTRTERIIDETSSTFVSLCVSYIIYVYIDIYVYITGKQVSISFQIERNMIVVIVFLSEM